MQRIIKKCENKLDDLLKQKCKIENKIKDVSDMRKYLIKHIGFFTINENKYKNSPFKVSLYIHIPRDYWNEILTYEQFRDFIDYPFKHKLSYLDILRDNFKKELISIDEDIDDTIIIIDLLKEKNLELIEIEKSKNIKPKFKDDKDFTNAEYQIERWNDTIEASLIIQSFKNLLEEE